MPQVVRETLALPKKEGDSWGEMDNTADMRDENLSAVMASLQTIVPSRMQFEADVNKAKTPISFSLPTATNTQIERLDEFSLDREDYWSLDRVSRQHVDFLQKKKINLKNPVEIPQPTTEERELIRQKIITTLIREERNPICGDCISDNASVRKKKMADFTNAFPEILDTVTGYLSELLNEKYEKLKPISSFSALLALRHLEFDNCYDSDSKWSTSLNKKVYDKLTMFHAYNSFTCTVNCPASLIISTILYELEGRVIASYDLRSDSDSARYARSSTRHVFC